MTRRSGFTLVELVLVISLTLVLTAGAISGLRGVDTWRASSAVRRVQTDLQYARDLAVLSARRTLCVFDLDSMTYEIRQEPTPGGGAISGNVLAHPLTEQPWEVAVSGLSGGLRITSVSTVDPPTFGFGADGRPLDPAGTALRKDVGIRFSNGAALSVRAGSGLCEVRWP